MAEELVTKLRYLRGAMLWTDADGRPIPLASEVNVALREAADRIEALTADRSSSMGVKGLNDIAAERARQISKEGWSAAHDDTHTNGELATAAGVYALVAGSSDRHWIINGLSGNDYIAAAMKLWPWDRSWFKPSTPRRDLIKAAALIVAEIDRLDRLSALVDHTGGMEDEPKRWGHIRTAGPAVGEPLGMEETGEAGKVTAEPQKT